MDSIEAWEVKITIVRKLSRSEEEGQRAFKSLGARLYEAREALRLTQSQVADGASVTRGYYSQLENGRKRGNASTVRRIAAVLKLDGPAYADLLEAALQEFADDWLSS